MSVKLRFGRLKGGYFWGGKGDPPTFGKAMRHATALGAAGLEAVPRACSLGGADFFAKACARDDFSLFLNAHAFRHIRCARSWHNAHARASSSLERRVRRESLERNRTVICRMRRKDRLTDHRRSRIACARRICTASGRTSTRRNSNMTTQDTFYIPE